MEATSSMQIPEVHTTPSLAKFGMKVFLASEGMLFAGLIAAYIVLRSGVEGWPPTPAPKFGLSWPPTPFNWLMIGNTCLLIASSFTYHWAEAAMHKHKNGLLWLLATIALGGTFVGVQAYEWWHLHEESMWFGSHGVYSSSFFVLTGFHGLHVMIGLLFIVWVFFKALGRTLLTGMGRKPDPDFTYTECVGLYWHFVDVVWIFLFLILYVL